MALEIIVKGIDQASSVLNKVGDAIGGLAGLAGGALTAGLGAATAGLAALGAGLAYGVSQAIDAENAMAQTEAVIKSTGGAAGLTADAIADLASELSKTSTFADDAIQQGENLLLTFTNIGKDVFPQATQALVDMAAAMGTDVKSGAIQLGKALNDPIAGIAALSRVGVTFTDEQKKVIEQMVKTGDVAGAQKVILAELNKEFGGSAAAAADTFGGKMQQLQNRLDGVAETIGGAILPILVQLFDTYITPNLPALESFADGLAKAFSVMQDGESAVNSITDGLSNLFYLLAGSTGIDLFNDLGDGLSALPDVISAATTEFDRLFKKFVGGVPLSGILKEALGNLITPEQAFDLGNMFGPFLRALTELPDRVNGFFNILQQGAPLSLALRYALEGLIPPSILDALANLTQAFEGSSDIIRRAVEGLAAKVLEQFSVMDDTLITNVSTAINALADLWNQHGNTIITIVTGFAGIIIATLTGALTLLSGAVAAALQLLSGDWDGAWQTMQDTFSTFLDQVLALAGTNLAAVQESWTGTLNLMLIAVTAIFTNIINSVVTAMTNFVNTVKKGIGDALAGALTFVSQAGAVGTSLINAMIDGVVSAAGGLAAAAVKAVQDALAAAGGAITGTGATAGGSVGGGAGGNRNAEFGGGAGGGSGGGSTTNNTLVINTPVAPSVPYEFQQARASAGAW